MIKPWFTSRTVWFNIGAAIVTFVVAMAQAISGQVVEIDPTVQATAVALFVSVVNVILRFVTREGIS
jgi:hypothetical protein